MGLVSAHYRDEQRQAAAANHLRSRPTDVLPARVGILPGKNEGGPPDLPGLGQARRPADQPRNSRRNTSAGAHARRKPAHRESARHAGRSSANHAIAACLSAAPDRQHDDRPRAARIGHRPARLRRQRGRHLPARWRPRACPTTSSTSGSASTAKRESSRTSMCKIAFPLKSRSIPATWPTMSSKAPSPEKRSSGPALPSSNNCLPTSIRRWKSRTP